MYLENKVNKTQSPITCQEIYDITGQHDHDIVTAIRRTGATPDEVMQAQQWLEEDHCTRAIFMRPMSTRIRRVYDLLDFSRNNLD